jgi:DHA1 family multidrug resistance protein-like MFS transporter
MSSPVPEINWKKNLLFVWLSQLLSLAGFAFAMPFIAVYIRDTWGITGEKELGVWMAAFNFFGMLSFCISTPIWGILADRYGRKLMLLRAYYADAVIFPCFLLAPNPYWLIAARFIASAFTGTVSASQTIVVTTTPKEHHGFALGLLMSAIWTGNLIGLAAGGFVVQYCGYTIAFITCGAMYFIGGLLAHIFVVDNFQPEEASETKESVLQSMSGLSLGVWLVFGLIVITAVARKFDEPYIPLMVECIHGPDKTAMHTGWISALAALGGMISGALIGKLCDLYSPKRITVPALLASGVTMAMQGLTMSLIGYASWRFLHYVAAGGLEAIYLSILSKVTPANRQGAVFGLSSSLRMGGILIATVVSGFIIYYLGVRAIYLSAGVIFLLTIPFYWLTDSVIRKNNQDSQNLDDVDMSNKTENL